jgi:alpha-N-arabinofuranosidase
MPTFGEWERVVLTHTYDDVDFISCHAYYEVRDDLGSFLASGVNMDRFIESVVATADHVKAVKGSSKTINISFDEWNVWSIDRFEKVDKITGIDNWPVAPRLLEDEYTVADAVVVGGLLISLLKHADRVTSASLAQLVNVIAPIMTEPGGAAWRQTTFFPFALTSAHARGTAIDLSIDSPTYDTLLHGEVPVVDGVGALGEDGRIAVYLVNRSETEQVEVRIALPAEGLAASAVTLADDDIWATNTAERPNRVTPSANTSVVQDGAELTIVLPPVSWTEVLLESPPA